MSSVYDLIVIGSGPAGQRAAIYAAKLGKKVALVEMREVVGGACINTGTIPSKTMREAVLHLSGFNYKSIYGMNYRVKERITMADLAFRVQHVIKTEIDVTEAQLQRNNIEMIVGTASFSFNNARSTIRRGKLANSRVSTEYVRQERSSSLPRERKSRRFQREGAAKQHHRSSTSDQIIADAVNIPKSMIVVGGGVIGVEYTCMFSRRSGVRVILDREGVRGCSNSRMQEIDRSAFLSPARPRASPCA